MRHIFSITILCSFILSFHSSAGQSKNNSMSAHDLLFKAEAFHWNGEWDSAYVYYQSAIKIEPSYKPKIVSLLDEMNRWDEIISIIAPMVEKGERKPARLGPLYTAYFKSKQKVNAEKTIQILIDTEYQSAYENSYKNYIISYHHLFNGDEKKSLKFLEKVKNDAIRKYAKESKKFKPLFDNKKFIQLTS